MLYYVAVVALRDIPAFTELTYDYQYQVCWCVFLCVGGGEGGRGRGQWEGRGWGSTMDAGVYMAALVCRISGTFLHSLRSHMTTSTRWGVGVKDRSGWRLVDQNSAFGSATSANELFHSVVVQCCACSVCSHELNCHCTWASCLPCFQPELCHR
jgi:hypothetical protein